MTAEPLKPLPCPFCGSGSEDLYCDGHYVHCEVCNTTGPSVYPVPDDDAAIAAWNRRVEPIGNSDELPIRSEVKTFAEFMEVSLKLNDYKGGWRNKTPDWLMSRLKDEVQDLQAALDFALYNEEKIGECVDVANYAMMIADVLSLRREDAE